MAIGAICGPTKVSSAVSGRRRQPFPPLAHMGKPRHAACWLSPERRSVEIRGFWTLARPNVRHGKAPSELLENHHSVSGSNVRLGGIDGRAPGVGLELAVTILGDIPRARFGRN